MVTTANTAPNNGAGAARTQGNTHAEPVKLRKRIGSTTFIVNVHFSNDNTESVEDKVLRLIKREAGRLASPNCSPMQPGVRDSA